MKASNWAVVVSAGFGAGMAYLMDPDRGRRRRALLRDQMTHAVHRTSDALDTTSRDLRNRAQGMGARVRSSLYHEDVSDHVLEERVRARLGRLVSHPGAIEVSASDGVVTLSGPILGDEVDYLLRRISTIRGVRAVEDDLEVHDEAGDVSALQGGVGPRRERSEFMQSNWSPSARLVAGAAGGAIALMGLGWTGVARAVLGSAGLSLLARAATNREFAEMTGLSRRERGIVLEKAIHINAPVERVFELWSNFENLPHFMSHVRKVERTGEDRTRWTVEGPAGVSINWRAVTTAFEPNRLIAWRTERGAPVDHEGAVHFIPHADNHTEVEVKLAYTPVGGSLGHAIATLLGADPKSRMDDDLLRMKTFIETGVPPHDAAAKEEQSREYH